ncbi:MAG: Flp pilus assembly protein CpaB, partial [Actinomycetospora chiangmaiensis]|nr:Flp pilus assembly protein CpaB [Actinomycetospora chiangmaiensis]
LPAGAIVRQGEPGFLAAILRPGLRAVSVPTGIVESNFGLVSSGDIVDVILALKRTDGPAAPAQAATSPYLAAQTILHGVRVLALNNQVRGDTQARVDDPEAKHRGERGASGNVDANARTVTLEVSPGDAERLAVAKEIGTLQLALRSAREPDRDSASPPGGMTTVRETTDLYAGGPYASAGPLNIRMFRGDKSETVNLNRR